MTQYKATSPKIAEIQVDDSSITETLLAISHLGRRYGTKENDTLDDFGTTVKNMFYERIGKPIGKWASEPKTFFSQPYTKQETVKAVLLGFVAPLMTLLTGFGVISISLMLSNLLGFFALPATFELLAGVISLGQAAWNKAWGFWYRNEADMAAKFNHEAEAYFLDAMTRFVLAIPLAIVSFLSSPVDLVRFVTRSISTLIYGFRPEKPKFTVVTQGETEKQGNLDGIMDEDRNDEYEDERTYGMG